MVKVALRKNPSHRLTTPEDVANALVALAQPCTYWLNGNVLYVDGGEAPQRRSRRYFTSVSRAAAPKAARWPLSSAT